MCVLMHCVMLCAQRLHARNAAPTSDDVQQMAIEHTDTASKLVDDDDGNNNIIINANNINNITNNDDNDADYDYDEQRSIQPSSLAAAEHASIRQILGASLSQRIDTADANDDDDDDNDADVLEAARSAAATTLARTWVLCALL
jgi:hypothetical protein